MSSALSFHAHAIVYNCLNSSLSQGMPASLVSQSETLTCEAFREEILSILPRFFALSRIIIMTNV